MKEHGGAVYRFALRLTGERALAEDVLQETFARALVKHEGLRELGSARAWLFAIARNEVLMARRLKAGEPAAFEDTESVESLGLAAGWGEEGSPEVWTQRLEARAELERALGRLDPLAREVLVLRELEGVPGEETAEILGLTLPAMKSRLHRARLHLVAALKENA